MFKIYKNKKTQYTEFILQYNLNNPVSGFRKTFINVLLNQARETSVFLLINIVRRLFEHGHHSILYTVFINFFY